jgi:DNA helicase-2/ATP-dependent DNA helicase PcrA
MYLKSKIYGNEFTYKHIVVDEVQDYSLFQLEVIKKLTSNNSMTIVGDLGQGIYYYKGISDWNKVIQSTFNQDIKYVQMAQSYRSTIEIINFANKVLKKQKIELEPAAPVIRHGEEPEILKIERDLDFLKELNEISNRMEKLNKNRIAIIGKDLEECVQINFLLRKAKDKSWKLIRGSEDIIDFNRIIIPSYMTKGLEFDCTIIYDCNNEKYRNTEMDKKLLYVALTRALHFVYVYYKGDKSNLLD